MSTLILNPGYQPSQPKTVMLWALVKTFGCYGGMKMLVAMAKSAGVPEHEAIHTLRYFANAGHLRFKLKGTFG